MGLIARSTFMFGTALLIAGLLWRTAIAKGVAEIWPAVLDKPGTAMIVAILGFVLLFLGRRIQPTANRDGGGVADDRADEEPRTGLNPNDFSDMLQDVATLTSRRSSTSSAKPDTPCERVTEEPVAENEDVPDSDASAKIAMAALARLQEDARQVANRIGGRTSFHVALAEPPCDSWIGGNPSLPVDQPWPEIKGVPAAFLAQVDLSEVQPEIWGGIGPREGWLSFFSASDPRDGVVVLHTQERGRVVEAPLGAASLFPPRAAERRLADLVGPEALVAPCFALEGLRDDTAEPVVSANPSEILREARLDDPGFYPFDWVSAFALLDSLTVSLLRLTKRWEAETAPTLTTDAAAVAREARMMTLARLRLLSRQTETRAEAHDFDEDEADDLLSSVADLTTEGWHPGKRGQPLLSLPLFRAYKPLLELHARRVFAKAPDRLPRPLRRVFEPMWQELADCPSLVMGGSAPKGHAMLMTLRGGGLSGWSFGPRNMLSIALPEQALKAGDFSQVRVIQPRSTRTEPTE